MKSTEYAAGLAAGIVVALLLFAVLYKFSRNNLKGHFDERQELIRGRGYKAAFFTVIVLLTIDLLADGFGVLDVIPVTRPLVTFAILLTGVVVYAVYCIRYDSYFGVGMDARTYKAVMWIVIVLNAVSAFTQFRAGAFENGKLAFGPSSQVLFVIAFALIMISLHIRKTQIEKEDTDEESEA